MIVHPCPQRPWEIARSHAEVDQPLPDFNDLDDDPQLASVAILQVAAKVTAESLLAQHGVSRRLVDQICDDPVCIIAVLAHVIVGRCNEMSELIAAYRLVARHPPRDDLDEFPF